MTCGPDTPLHLVLGDCAAAVLRHAVRVHGLPGDVHCIPDDLGFGPLHDGVVRMDFWRRCFDGFDDWLETGSDAFVDWQDLQRRLKARPQPLVVWRAENASETVLLAMACWWFGTAGVPLIVAEPPNGRHGGTWPSADLLRFYDARRLLSAQDIEAQAALFERLRTDSAWRRVWRDGKVEAAPVSAFDDLVVAACARTWRPAAQVVSVVMAAADARDALSDVFLSTRLRALIGAGHLEADAPVTHLRNYAVRLTNGACDDHQPTRAT